MATIVTKTIKASGGDYTSLSAWEAAQQGDLTGVRDEIARAVYYALADTMALTIDGWTTSATQYITTECDPTGRHAGAWDGDKYNIRGLVTVNETYTRIDGIQVEQPTTGSNDGIKFTAANCRFSNAILKGNSSRIALWVWFSGSMQAWNIVAHGWTTATYAPVYVDLGTTLNLYNASVYCADTSRCYQLWTVTSVLNAYNCVGYNTGTNPVFHNRADGTLGGDYNCSSDTSSPGVNSLDNRGLADIDWVSTGSGTEDLHIQATSDLIDAGTNDPGAGLFSDDIDGVTRTGTWDIGADEYVAAAPSAVNVVYNII